MTQRPTQFIHSDIARGRQSVNAIFLFDRGTAKARIKICSDAYDFQSFARVELFSTTNLDWNVVGYIPYPEMKTPHKLAYMPTGTDRENFMADFDRLLGIVDGLVGVASPVTTGPVFVLFFADIPEGHSVEAGLIGPKFFKDQRSALIRFVQYLAPRIGDNDELRELLAICLGLEEEADCAAVIEKLPETELLNLLADSQLEHLMILCDSYVSHQVMTGSLAFYRVEQVPATLD
ncbi:hypothetical protein [Pseudomonas baetica]|uniref:hypothetical protein n=1 Tax=Pseudomonas baetica TaxID=674054 RepID=UPI00240502B0|nr:hypothetical protein [Pseudomonas baetica]MDF9779045.1 hypothetical protein [Pseudomonas baetica]